MRPARNDGPNGLPRRRALNACNNCRRKKLRCDAKRPSCHNCSTQGVECIQTATSQKPRPTNRRIELLEQEIRRLRQLAVQAESVSTYNALNQTEQLETSVSQGSILAEKDFSDHETSLPNAEKSRHPGIEDTSSPSELDFTPQVPGAQISAETPERGVSQYYGPTSAFFDESYRQTPRALSCTKDSAEQEHYARYLLVAECSKQRQLEAINRAAGVLDFDGVDPQLAAHLLSIYWCHQLHCGLIVYRPAFMRDMACGGPYFSKLLLNAMYFSASKHSPRIEIRQDANDRSTAGWLYRQRFKEILTHEYDKSKITTIQGLLIMAVSLFSRCNERSASWLYAGNAFNMIIDLGLHVFPLKDLDNSSTLEEDLEVRRRVYWGAYILDKLQCLYQGRPPNLRISDANIAMNFLDDYEELEYFDMTSFTEEWSHGAVPLRYTSTMKKLCELSVVMERILTNLYAGNYPIRNPESFYWDSMSLQLELEDWRKSLPHYLDCISYDHLTSPPLPHQLGLLALYNVLIILLRRPLIAGQQQPSAAEPCPSSTIAYESFVACVKAANEVVETLRTYKQHFSLGSAPYLLSYTAYIAATILVRIVGQAENTSGAYHSLRTCLEALEEHKHLYAAAVEARVAIDKLMERLGVVITSEQQTCTIDLNNTNPDAT